MRLPITRKIKQVRLPATFKKLKAAAVAKRPRRYASVKLPSDISAINDSVTLFLFAFDQITVPCGCAWDVQESSGIL